MAPPRLAVLLAAATLLACASARSRPAPAAPVAGAGGEAEVSFPPEELTVSALDAELEGRNDAELLAIGTAAYGAGDFARAAAAFTRLADRFPGSPHEAAALLDAGRAFQQLGEWRLALERFRALERRGGPEAVEAAFKSAECLYHLDELGETWAALDALAGRADLPEAERIRALAQRGVVELEEDRAEEAERTFRDALALYQAASGRERLDPYYPSQAQFYLGETYRGWFEALPLDPSQGDEAKLQRDLDHKAELLLSAQGHYLRAIRMGDERWAVAAGLRIGDLYDVLRSQLLDAPLPPGLDEEHGRTYRRELRRRVRVLAASAITAYEQTLARAARAGVDDLAVLRSAQESLARLREAIREDGPGT